jgi:hypothetical protein
MTTFAPTTPAPPKYPFTGKRGDQDHRSKGVHSCTNFYPFWRQNLGKEDNDQQFPYPSG